MTKILCVEDEELLRKDIAEELEDADYDVMQAGNGKEALDVILAKKPDLVISDIMMPEMDGIELVKELRENHPEFADTPFIFLSALSDKKDIKSGLTSGADDYLTKPIDFDLLLAKVSAAVRLIERMNKLKKDQQVKLYKALSKENATKKVVEDKVEEKNTDKKNVPPTHDSLPPHFKALIRKSAADGGVSSASRLHFVNLMNLKFQLGDERWEKSCAKVHAISESIIKKHLQPTDSRTWYGDDAFFLLFAGLDEREGHFKAEGIANEIATRILGEDAHVGRNLEMETTSSPVQALLNKDGDVTPESMNAAFDNQQAEQKNKKSTNIVKRYLSQLSLKFKPLWSPNRELISAFLGVPYRESEAGILTGSDVLENGVIDPLTEDLDFWIAEHIAKEMKSSSHSSKAAPIVLPMHFRTLVHGDKQALKRIFKDIDPRLLATHLIVEVIGIPHSLGAIKPWEVITPIQEVTNLIAAEYSPAEPNAEDLKRSGVKLFGFDMQHPETVNMPNVNPNTLGIFARQAKSMGIRTYVYGADTIGEAKMCEQQGFNIIAGKAIGMDSEHLQEPYQLSKNRAIGG